MTTLNLQNELLDQVTLYDLDDPLFKEIAKIIPHEQIGLVITHVQLNGLDHLLLCTRELHSSIIGQDQQISMLSATLCIYPNICHHFGWFLIMQESIMIIKPVSFFMILILVCYLGLPVMITTHHNGSI